MKTDRFKKGFAPIYILLVIAVVGGIIVAIYLNTLGNFIQKSMQPTVSPSSIASDTTACKIPEGCPDDNYPVKKTDETAKWKTYTSQSLGFLIKYPPDFKMEETLIRVSHFGVV